MSPRKKTLFKFCFVAKLIAILFFSTSILAQEKSNVKVTGFVDFNIYNDTRNFGTLTYNILLQLSDRIQYFSLTNHDGLSNSPDIAVTYAEHNLRYKLTKTSPLDLTLQYVLRNGEQNDDIKLGFRWRLNNTNALKSFFKKLNMTYSINPMLIQFRNKAQTKYATQLEHVYNIYLFANKFNKRLYLGGFADQLISYNNNKISFTWVTEHQLGYQILNNFYAVLEFRVNDFFKERYGLGYGLEYKVIF